MPFLFGNHVLIFRNGVDIELNDYVVEDNKASSRDYSYNLASEKPLETEEVEEVSFINKGQYSPRQMLTNYVYDYTYGHTDKKIAGSPAKKRTPKLDSYLGSASQNPNMHLRTTVRPNGGGYAFSSSKYNYETGARTSYVKPSANQDGSYYKHLYTYLSDNYDQNYSPLKMTRHNNPYNKSGLFKESKTADTIKGIRSVVRELTEKKHLRSPKKYGLSHSLSKANHNVVNPEFVKPDYLIDHQNLEKADFKMDDLEKERKINKDLLKVGNGYLEMCRGMLDSIKAVKIGNVALAETAFTQNRVVMGEADAKKGKEFLEQDAGFKLEEVEIKSEKEKEAALEGEDGEVDAARSGLYEERKKNALRVVSRGVDIKAISQNILNDVFAGA